MSGNRRKSKRYYYDNYGRQITPDMAMTQDLPPADIPPEMGMDVDMEMGMGMDMNIGMEGMPVATLPMNVEFAKAYIAIQYYNMAFSPQEALMRGTLFPELYQPRFYIKPIPR
jgi:hypothetical protein